MTQHIVHRVIFVFMALSAAGNWAAQGAVPDRINYQGVLRNSSGAPLNGSFDMIFRLHDALEGGAEILIDQHTATNGGSVVVQRGLCSVELGGGTVSDGSGPGTYTSLSAVFSAYGTVWLSIQVGSEILAPRVQVLSAAYALNAQSLGGRAGTEYLDTSFSAQTKAGMVTFSAGVRASGTSSGGSFSDSNDSGHADAGYGDYGIHAYGNQSGGFFYDSDHSGSAYVGYGDYGVYGSGQAAGGYFYDSNSSGKAYVGYGDIGVHAGGQTAGGYFNDSNGTGYAYVGYGDEGIRAFGNGAGGFFVELDGSGAASVAIGDRGINASGNEAGGEFSDSDHTGKAYVGYGNYGVYAEGSYTGGYFHDTDSSGMAYVGNGDYGVNARGSYAGGYFYDSDNSGLAFIGYGNYGVHAKGSTAGGYFYDSDDSGSAFVGYGDYGVSARGTYTGGRFQDDDSSSYAMVGYSTYKIFGSGTVSFVQNHPYDPGKVIVYAAPEGDEIATYTRGSARLENGVAHVALGETFRWVTNPDIGLTAHLTARGASPVPLAVELLTTQELVVRGPAGSSAAFDYLVFGLRLGFEESSIVQAKTAEARIPSMKDHRQAYAKVPELRAYNALERFKRMIVEKGEGVTDFRASQELLARVQEYDPALHGAFAGSEGTPDGIAVPPEAASLSPGPEGVVRPASSGASVVVADDGVRGVAGGESLSTRKEEVDASAATPLNQFVVNEAVELGDLLALDPSDPLQLHRAAMAGDPYVVGVVIAPCSLELVRTCPLAGSGFVRVHVDAGYGAIRSGDLLISSPTPGYAMRSGAAIPGTVIGKALEPLEVGIGTIRVLLSPR